MPERTDVRSASRSGGGRILPAQHQTSQKAASLLHSGNAGFIIARSAQLRYEYRQEGREFFLQVAKFMNNANMNDASFFVYEEAFGNQDRLHWLIHLKNPADYAISLDMVDHDKEMIDILESEEVVDDKANWGRTVVESTVQEKILVPQHGVHHEEGEDHDKGDLWVDPAWHQAAVPAGKQLNSANAALVLHRVGQAKHELRKEARYFAFAWQNYVNEQLAGAVTSYLYEETFGVMDSLHWLIHFRSFVDYETFAGLESTDAEYRDIMGRQFVPKRKGGGTWGQTFVDGSIRDTLLVPYQVSTSTG